MSNCLEKQVICSYGAGDWFDKIPLANLIDGGITAINVDRRFGKTTFIANAVKKILSQDMADHIVIKCGYIVHSKFMERTLKEVLGDDYKKQYPQIDIVPNEHNMITLCSDKRRTVTFIDEFASAGTTQDVRDILESEITADAQTWVILGTSYEGSLDIREKNPFVGLLEMPFVRTFEVVGRIPENCLVYFDEKRKQIIKMRQEVFPTISFGSFE
jgi:hypothetical protein